jgi:hypothetical protein
MIINFNKNYNCYELFNSSCDNCNKNISFYSTGMFINYTCYLCSYIVLFKRKSRKKIDTNFNVDSLSIKILNKNYPSCCIKNNECIEIHKDHIIWPKSFDFNVLNKEFKPSTMKNILDKIDTYKLLL